MAVGELVELGAERARVDQLGRAAAELGAGAAWRVEDSGGHGVSRIAEAVRCVTGGAEKLAHHGRAMNGKKILL